jgi:division protein CdvB (Snf7/Vps24/ESCRT-III family)
MNLLGKILTFLILLTSVAFCMVAIVVVASHQSWKETAEANRKTAEDFRKRFQNAEEQIATLRGQNEKASVARAQAIAYLNSQLAIERERYSAQILQVQNLRSQLDISIANLQSAESRLKDQDQQIQTFGQQNRGLAADLASQSQRVAVILSQVEAAEVKKEQLAAQLQQMMVEYNDLKKVADVVGIDKNTLWAQIPPDLTGRVTGISANQLDVFAVSLGLDDGLREGHTVDVVRNGRHIGTATVVSSQANNATAKFVDGMRNAMPQVGDEVTTVLAKRLNTSLPVNN